jgi:hypothetical protein
MEVLLVLRGMFVDMWWWLLLLRADTDVHRHLKVREGENGAKDDT